MDVPPRILADTGPLVAYLDRNDKYHAWAVARFRELAPPFLTCESVLSGACFLLRHAPGGVKALGELMRRNVLRIDFDLADEWERVNALMLKYASMPASLADACLIRMAELHSKSAVFTVDSDFRRYRRNGRAMIPLIDPAP